MNDREALELLEALVRTPSPSRDEGRAARMLVERMRELGFDAALDAAGNAVGRVGSAGPRLALVGHIDTVPGEVPVRIEAGRLYGRGAVDAKGCLAAFVAAAARAHRTGGLAFRVEIAACVEEEVATSRGARYRATRPAPDALIVGEPSGAHAVTLGYKGYLAARLAYAEPLAHTAGPNVGAPGAACRQFVRLEEEAARRGGGADSLFDALLVHLAGVSSSNDGMTTSAELDLRLRLPPSLPPAEAARWLEEHSPGWSVETEGAIPAWSGPRTSPLARHLGRAIAARGTRPKFQRKTGTADLNLLAPAWGCPALAYGPGDSALDHTPDEHIEVRELIEGVAVLEALLVDEALAGALLGEAAATAPRTTAPPSTALP